MSELHGYITCRVCGEFKCPDQYNWSVKYITKRYICKTCEKDYNRNYRIKNKEYLNAKSRQYVINHKEEIDAYRNRMRSHVNERSKVYRYKNKSKIDKRRYTQVEYVDKYLRSHPCTRCGEDRIECLVFHHVRGEKFNNVTTLANLRYSAKIIDEEISKCDILCKNCHDTYHSGLRTRQKTRIPVAINIAYKKQYLLVHPCSECGESRIECLTFHHIRGPKIAEVAKIAKEGRAISILVAEIEKCEVLCGNCHQIRSTRDHNLKHAKLR